MSPRSMPSPSLSTDRIDLGEDIAEARRGCRGELGWAELRAPRSVVREELPRGSARASASWAQAGPRSQGRAHQASGRRRGLGCCCRRWGVRNGGWVWLRGWKFEKSVVGSARGDARDGALTSSSTATATTTTAAASTHARPSARASSRSRTSSSRLRRPGASCAAAMSRSKSPSPILILDNGASTIKAGLASDPAYSAPRCARLALLPAPEDRPLTPEGSPPAAGCSRTAGPGPRRRSGRSSPTSSTRPGICPPSTTARRSTGCALLRPLEHGTKAQADSGCRSCRAT